MTTIKNPAGYLQAIKTFLKRAWNSDEAIESLINQIKDKPELLKKFQKSSKPTITWLFSFKYPENATDEEINRLMIKASIEYKTKQSLADSEKKTAA